MPDRKRPIHGVKAELYTPTIVFVTVCTKDRRRVLASSTAHTALLNAWQAANAWMVGRYVVMPDHIHLFAAPTADVELANWIRFWKSHFTKQFGYAIWQSDFWDRRLRTGESYEEKWDYVLNNPVRHGLVEMPDEWPFQGQIHNLAW